MYWQYTSKISEAISAGGEFREVQYYCQITRRCKTKQTSIVYHQDRTLSCTIFGFRCKSLMHSYTSNANVKFTYPKNCVKLTWLMLERGKWVEYTIVYGVM